MINGRSFVLAAQAVPDMNAVQLNDKTVLSWYDGLSVTFSEDKKYVLIGDCWSIREGEDPARYIAETRDLSAENILARENTWCGRYVLILEDRIYMDAVGSMSVFYHDAYISNSLNMIRELLGYELKQEKLYDGLAPDFVPGPGTQYDGVKRLMPSQVYDHVAKSVISRALLPEYPIEFSSDEERIQCFVKELAQGMKNLDKYYEGKTKLITCTGGRDSRTVLAVSEFAGLKYGTATLEHSEIGNADIEIPRQLSRALDRKHYYIRRDKKDLSRERYEAFDRHICNYEKGADRDFYAYGQFEKLRKEVGSDIVLLRGSVRGAANKDYLKTIVSSDYDCLQRLYPLLSCNPIYRQSVKDWLDYVSNDPENDLIGPAERVYRELREGCWLSTIEGVFDIYDDITSVQPLNCRRLISLLLGFDVVDRTKKLHEEKITAYADPRLGAIPYDYQLGGNGAGRARQISGYLKKILWILGNYGPGGLIRFLKGKIGRN